MMESYPVGVPDWGQARACRTGEPVELTVIIAGLLLAVDGLVVLGGLVLRVGAAHRQNLLLAGTQDVRRALRGRNFKINTRDATRSSRQPTDAPEHPPRRSSLPGLVRAT